LSREWGIYLASDLNPSPNFVEPGSKNRRNFVSDFWGPPLFRVTVFTRRLEDQTAAEIITTQEVGSVTHWAWYRARRAGLQKLAGLVTSHLERAYSTPYLDTHHPASCACVPAHGICGTSSVGIVPSTYPLHRVWDRDYLLVLTVVHPPISSTTGQVSVPTIRYLHQPAVHRYFWMYHRWIDERIQIHSLIVLPACPRVPSDAVSEPQIQSKVADEVLGWCESPSICRRARDLALGRSEPCLWLIWIPLAVRYSVYLTCTRRYLTSDMPHISPLKVPVPVATRSPPRLKMSKDGILGWSL
jgi:hypothetical protein